jgi:hypothetical protein
MAQVTWRAPEELVERVRLAAKREGRSMNDYLSWVLNAATNPELAGDDALRLRERLDRAGLLAMGGAPRARPDAAALERARAAAGTGTPLSGLVGEGRGG